MRILKCYLANNTRNQFVIANEAAKADDDTG
ncbi:putative zinc ribbon protein [Pectobacterium sp. CHL-2024]